MFYPKADCCPFNAGDNLTPDFSERNAQMRMNVPENEPAANSKCEMMRQIQELDFAIIDLNLFLDTHPECTGAMELFKKLTATSKSLKNDYQKKYGPLYVANTPENLPFSWSGTCDKWPWER